MSITMLDAKQRILTLMPPMPGWTVYHDMATGMSPPWIVIRIRETGRDLTEAVAVTNRMITVDVRVVSDTADGIDIACMQYQQALDGVHPQGMGALVPYTDSGIYSSDVLNTATSTPFLMRVLTWRCGE